MVSNLVVYTDQGPTTDGTALAANNLNTAVTAQSYLISGGLITEATVGSPTVDGLGIDVIQPQTEAVIARGDLTGYVLVPAQTIALSGLNTSYDIDNYVDLILESTGTTYTGTYSVSAVPFEENPPPQPVGSLRLYRCTVDSIGHISHLHQLAPPQPVAQTMVSGDQIESQIIQGVGETSSIVANLNRIRCMIGYIVGGAWDAAVQMIPVSWRGAANGVAELDAAARLPNSELPYSPQIAGTLAVAMAPTPGYSLSVTGSTNLVGNAVLTGSAQVGGPLSVGTPFSPGYQLVVGGGNVAFSNDLALTGGSGTIALDLSVGRNATITGTLTAGAYATAAGATTTLSGPTTVSGLASLTGGATIGTSFEVTSSTAQFDHDLTVLGTLNVTGTAHLGGLTVSGYGPNSALGWCQLNSSAQVNPGNMNLEPLPAGTPAFTGVAQFVYGAGVNTLAFPVSSLPTSVTDGVGATTVAAAGTAAALPGSSGTIVPWAYIKVWVNDRVAYIPYWT